MSESDIEAKQIHTKKLEELLVAPIFDIFHVQRAQLEEKTESQNSLLFHFKASMAKVRTWNASTVKTFVDNLVTRFPVLGEEFDTAFEELQQVTCSILNASSNINNYEPVVQPSHTYIHEFISACADAFISFPEWFAVDSKSAEYQTCKNNAKVRMAQSGVVPNAVMTFIKTSRRQTAEEDANSDMDIFGDNQSTQSDQSVASDVSSVRGPKKINIKSGLVEEVSTGATEQPPRQERAASPEVAVSVPDQRSQPTDEEREATNGDSVVPAQQEHEGPEQLQDDESSPQHSIDTREENTADSDVLSLSFDGNGSLSAVDTSVYSDSMEYTSSSSPDTESSTDDSIWSSDDSCTDSDTDSDTESDTESDTASDSTSTADSSEVSLYWESVSDGSFYTAHESDMSDD